jgi:hypothetical protein
MGVDREQMELTHSTMKTHHQLQRLLLDDRDSIASSFGDRDRESDAESEDDGLEIQAFTTDFLR